MTAIAIIPARGQSKRIPRKNLRYFAGKPLLAYAVDACLARGYFAQVIVTTEDAEIASLARKLGARVHDRPAALADDFAPLAPVVLDVLAGNYGMSQEVAVVLANPFVRAADIVDGCVMAAGNYGPVATVARLPVPVERVLRRDDDGTLSMPAMESTRTQDLPAAYHDAGQFYVTWHGELAASGQLLVGTYPFVLPRERVCDLDTEDDWRAAELMWRFLDGKR